jgi:Fic family protein
MNLTYLEIDHQRSHYDSLTGSEREAFLDRLMLGWLYHDHALEGIVLTQHDIWRALSGQPVRNYCDGLVAKSLCRMRDIAMSFFGEETRPDELTMDFIKELHCRLCDDDDEKAGRYRKRDTSPGVYNLKCVAQGSISYYFHKFIDTWNDELVNYHPIRAAAIAHWEFMKVFPFDERSGMVGRLMMNYLLIREGYPPAVIHAMDRHHYFAALDGYRTDLVPVLVDAISSTIEAARVFSEQKESANDQKQIAL